MSKLKQRMAQCAGGIPLIRRRVPLEEAIARFRREGQADKARLLGWRPLDYFDEYVYDGYADYFYGEMLPSTAYLTVWDILPADNGFLFLYPDDQNPEVCAKVPSMPISLTVFNEGRALCSLMECETAADLNELTTSGRNPGTDSVNEALHEKAVLSGSGHGVCQRGRRP